MAARYSPVPILPCTLMFRLFPQRIVLLIALPLLARPMISAQRAAPVPAAEDLVMRAREARQAHSLSGSARLVQTDSRTGRTTITRLLVKARKSGQTTTTLYQVTGPASAPRQAVVIEITPGRRAIGFLVDPTGTVTPLDPIVAERSFLGSDLAIGDLDDEFLWWPFPRSSGEERVLGRRCAIIEVRAPGVAPGVARVRCWISVDLALLVKIEKYDHEGRLLRRLVVERFVRIDDRHWAPATVAVVAENGHTRTKLEGLRVDRNREVPASDFLPETIRRFVLTPAPRPPGRKAPTG